MKILLIGSGGREHALAWKLSQSPQVSEIVSSPGNPGIAEVARCVPAPSRLEDYSALAEHEGVDLTIVGPEAPLVAGIVDVFRARKLPIIGPTQAAARLEGSKIFAKAFFERAGIPTARTSDGLAGFRYPLVVKADGLAAGKGVVIAENAQEAEAAVAKFGPNVVIEEFLEGEEVSFIGLSNGQSITAFAPTQDHKRAYDGDEGPNTGGMGAYCDTRILTEAETEAVLERVMCPAIRQMRVEGTPFTGFLYAGLMMTAEGPKALEFNVRLGDPETQVLMQSLHSDLVEALLASVDGSVSLPALEFGNPSACVVAAAAGYPEHPITGQIVRGIKEASAEATVFQAGTALQNGQTVTGGGRVLATSATGATLQEAIGRAYLAMEKIDFAGMHYRRDIGKKGLLRW